MISPVSTCTISISSQTLSTVISSARTTIPVIAPPEVRTPSAAIAAAPLPVVAPIARVNTTLGAEGYPKPGLVTITAIT